MHSHYVAVGERMAPARLPGTPGQSYRVSPLRAALEESYAYDAHLVTYILMRDGKPHKRQPRLKKEYMPTLASQGFEVRHTVRVLDADCLKHADITPEIVARVAALLRDYPCLWYATRGGIRVVQTLTRPLTGPEYEITIQRWLAELGPALLPTGVVADPKCKDWTRLFRLPRVVREGRNLWDTPIHGPQALPDQEPGDCTPPPPPPKPTWTPWERTRVRPKNVFERAQHYVARCRHAQAGEGGHNRTYSVAMALIHGFQLSEPEVLSLMAEYNSRCDPPWSDRELKHKISSAQKAVPKNQPGWLLPDRRHAWEFSDAPIEPEEGFALEYV